MSYLTPLTSKTPLKLPAGAMPVVINISGSGSVNVLQGAVGKQLRVVMVDLWISTTGSFTFYSNNLVGPVQTDVFGLSTVPANTHYQWLPPVGNVITDSYFSRVSCLPGDDLQIYQSGSGTITGMIWVTQDATAVTAGTF